MEKVVKYSRPTVYDKAPFGRIWVAELEESKEQYIQLGFDENGSQWSKLCAFLEDNITDEEIEKILKRYM